MDPDQDRTVSSSEDHLPDFSDVDTIIFDPHHYVEYQPTPYYYIEAPQPEPVFYEAPPLQQQPHGSGGALEEFLNQPPPPPQVRLQQTIVSANPMSQGSSAHEAHPPPATDEATPERSTSSVPPNPGPSSQSRNPLPPFSEIGGSGAAALVERYRAAVGLRTDGGRGLGGIEYGRNSRGVTDALAPESDQSADWSDSGLGESQD